MRVKNEPTQRGINYPRCKGGGPTPRLGDDVGGWKRGRKEFFGGKVLGKDKKN